MESSEKPKKRQTILSITLGVLFIFLLVIGIWADLEYHWTGYSRFATPLTTEQLAERQKTIWDWLDLLLVPLVLAAGGLWFSWAERKNERAIAEQRALEDRRIAEQRAEREREIADENAQEAALQAYLEQMSALLIDKGLRTSDANDEMRAVARAWTLTVLRRVKEARKGNVVRFLYESDLIMKQNTIVSLVGANLFGADLSGVTLREANLTAADLGAIELAGADLSGAILAESNLHEANLASAHLGEANLAGTFLYGATLSEAVLANAMLDGTILLGADLDGADLDGATLKNSRYDRQTLWPEGFDPQAAGAILIED